MAFMLSETRVLLLASDFRVAAVATCAAHIVYLPDSPRPVLTGLIL